MSNVPIAPQWADYKDAKRKFTFVSQIVTGESAAPTEIELEQDFQFVGIVQQRDAADYRAVFFRQSTPFEVAQKEYGETLDALVAEAEAAGEQIMSLDDLEKWVERGKTAPEGIVDIADLRARMQAGQDEVN